MPRKPKVEKKTVTVVLDGVPVAVVLHPPTETRRSWYAYWNGLVASKSTGRPHLSDAVVVAEQMVRSWRLGGEACRPTPLDAMLTDEEFEAIQRAHFLRKRDPAEQVRAQKSLTSCLEAISAFKSISAMAPINFKRSLASADPDVCAAFQRLAIELPKNWRQHYPNGKRPEDVEQLSPNTALKWSRALQAAFHRANKNAGKKAIRGVVPEGKLLTSNPWDQFDWIKGRAKPIRQFDAGEILSLLDFLETNWPPVSVAPLAAKVFLWSCCRQQEVAALRWSSMRKTGDEVHFEINGKWGVERWFRIPVALYHQLEAVRTKDLYVFGAYNHQLRSFHKSAGRLANARRVGTIFNPRSLGDWFADRMDDWSTTSAKGRAYNHVFRKTSLQYVRTGEDINRLVASDAKVSESVLMTSYVKETDEQMRQSSNRTFGRILASLPSDLARRCGHVQPDEGSLEERIHEAVEAKDWTLAAELTARIASRLKNAAG